MELRTLSAKRKGVPLGFSSPGTGGLGDVCLARSEPVAPRRGECIRCQGPLPAASEHRVLPEAPRERDAETQRFGDRKEG